MSSQSVELVPKQNKDLETGILYCDECLDDWVRIINTITINTCFCFYKSKKRDPPVSKTQILDDFKTPHLLAPSDGFRAFIKACVTRWSNCQCFKCHIILPSCVKCIHHGLSVLDSSQVTFRKRLVDFDLKTFHYIKHDPFTPLLPSTREKKIVLCLDCGSICQVCRNRAKDLQFCAHCHRYICSAHGSFQKLINGKFGGLACGICLPNNNNTPLSRLTEVFQDNIN